MDLQDMETSYKKEIFFLSSVCLFNCASGHMKLAKWVLSKFPPKLLFSYFSCLSFVDFRRTTVLPGDIFH